MSVLAPLVVTRIGIVPVLAEAAAGVGATTAGEGATQPVTAGEAAAATGADAG